MSETQKRDARFHDERDARVDGERDARVDRERVRSEFTDRAMREETEVVSAKRDEKMDRDTRMNMKKLEARQGTRGAR